MYVSGNYKVANGGSRLVAMVTPVSTPSILEIAVEGNMFVTHYTLDMRCSFYDGRYVCVCDCNCMCIRVCVSLLMLKAFIHLHVT